MNSSSLIKIILLLVICLLFCFVSVFADLEINEIMYAPLDGLEWVEIFNFDNESFNLSNCFFYEKEIDDLILPAQSFLVFTNNLSAFEINNNSLFLESKFDNRLNNNGEVIKFYCNLSCGQNNSANKIKNYSFDYSDYVAFGNKNNKTLEKNKDKEWKESLIDFGTPGKKNSVYDFSYDYSVLKINEIMVDPEGQDEANKPNGEWVEIYNSGDKPISLRGLMLYDSNDADELYLTDINTNTLEIYPHAYVVVYRNGDRDFDLSKINDQVRLYTGKINDQGMLIDKVSFSSAMEGESFSRFEKEWFNTLPTPEEENQYTSGCDWGLKIITDNSIYQKDDFSFTLEIKRDFGLAENITVKGQIEDIFGNLIKEYSPWNNQRVLNSNKKSYSPNLPEGAYQISFILDKLKCEDYNLQNNKVTALIAINPQYKKTASSLEIEKISLGNDDQAEWGDQFTAKVNIYKGNTTRESAQMWAEIDGQKVSKTTKVLLYDQYKNYPLTLPIQLEPNCNQKISDGQATLVLEAFGLKTEKDFAIDDVDTTICKDYLDYLDEINGGKNTWLEEYSILELPEDLVSGGILNLKVQILNEDLDTDYKVWSYIYRGSKCYSCAERTREDNLQSFSMRANEAKIISFLLQLDEEMEEGDYKIKVKINKNNQKTSKELVKDIFIKKDLLISKELTSSVDVFAENELDDFSISSYANLGKEHEVFMTGGMVIYEDSSQKAKKLIPALLVFSLSVFCLVLVIKKKV